MYEVNRMFRVERYEIALSKREGNEEEMVVTFLKLLFWIPPGKGETKSQET
jgi:hypothetical protein